MSENAQNTQNIPRFVRIKEEAEAANLIAEGVKTFASTIIWTRNQEQVITTYLSSQPKDSWELCAWIPKGFDVKQFQEFLLQSGSSECLFSVSLTRANIFFSTELVRFDQTEFKFKFPSSVFKVQRRKDFRFPIPDGYVVYVEFDHVTDGGFRHKRKVVDVSAGGLSFAGDVSDVGRFQVGEVLRDLIFRIRNREIHATAEVRYCGDATKIGVKFTQISPSDVQHIAAYVFEESRKYFTKLL